MPRGARRLRLEGGRLQSPRPDREYANRQLQRSARLAAALEDAALDVLRNEHFIIARRRPQAGRGERGRAGGRLLDAYVAGQPLAFRNFTERNPKLQLS
jgi:hypothetical protein